MSGCDLLLFGATRNTGLWLARLARERGERVAAMVRDGSDAGELRSLGVEVIPGDAFQLDDCRRALQSSSPRRVVSVLGGKNAAGRRVDAEGNLNVIEALLAATQPVERFVLLTSMGCGEQMSGMSERALTMLGEALRAKTIAENRLRDIALAWTIVRPGGLNHEPPTGRYRLLEQPDRAHGAYLPRGDAAAAVLAVLDDEKYLHRVATVQGPVDEEGADA